MKQLNTIQKMEKLNDVFAIDELAYLGARTTYTRYASSTQDASLMRTTLSVQDRKICLQQSRCSVAQEKILTQSAVLLILTYWKLSETDFPLSSRVLIHLTKQLRRYTMLRERLCGSIVELKIAQRAEY